MLNRDSTRLQYNGSYNTGKPGELIGKSAGLMIKMLQDREREREQMKLQWLDFQPFGM